MSSAFSRWVGAQVDARGDVVLTWDALRLRHDPEEVDGALDALDDEALHAAALNDAFEGAGW